MRAEPRQLRPLGVLSFDGYGDRSGVSLAARRRAAVDPADDDRRTIQVRRGARPQVQSTGARRFMAFGWR
jgi:hypothetical protein